jgi:5-dehydro-4-deoxyglucarate dehydratase
LRLEPDELGRLCEIETLVAVKDGHRDVRLFRQLRTVLGARLLWVTAWEDVAPAFWAMGAEAFCPFSTAYAPEYSRAWLSALDAGRTDEADRLLGAHAHPMVDLRLSRPGIDVAVVKAAMTARGLPVGELRHPACSLTDEERNTVTQLVADIASALQPCGATHEQLVIASTSQARLGDD